jgi:hypothetical protein
MPGPASEPGHICPSYLAFYIQPHGKVFDELCVRFARLPPQLMIKMANNKPPVPKISQPMQERHGIAATRNANEVTPGRRKVRDDMRIESQFLRRLHAVQQATSVESRQDIKEQRFETAVCLVGGLEGAAP